jgi:hypothetical protein
MGKSRFKDTGSVSNNETDLFYKNLVILRGSIAESLRLPEEMCAYHGSEIWDVKL